MKEKLETSLRKLEFISSVIAYSKKDSIDLEGMYFVFTDIIEEMKEALNDVEDRPAYTAANKAA